MKAMLKLFILKRISDMPSTGYKIIKECEEKLGYKPSTGSIYPLLKSMEKDGLIISKKDGRRIIYSISPKGKEFVERLKRIREEFYQKLHSNIMAMAEIFDDNSLKNFGMLLKNDYMRKIIFLLERMNEKEANKMLEEFYRRIKNESNRSKKSGKRI